MIKINIPLTESELFNLMKGGIYEWEEVPHNKDKEIRVDIKVYGTCFIMRIWKSKNLIQDMSLGLTALVLWDIVKILLKDIITITK